MRRLTLPLVALTTACYTYAPVDPMRASPGTSLRARVSAAHAERIAPLLGTADARLLMGTVVDVIADTLLLEVPTMERVAVGGTFQRLSQRVGIPRDALLDAETRTFNRRRTTIVVTAIGAVAASVLFKALVIDPGRERSPQEPGGNEIRWTR